MSLYVVQRTNLGHSPDPIGIGSVCEGKSEPLGERTRTNNKQFLFFGKNNFGSFGRRLQTMYNIMLASLSGIYLVVGIMPQAHFRRKRNIFPHWSTDQTDEGILQYSQNCKPGESFSSHRWYNYLF